MRPSVVQLRQFYSSRLGRRVKQRLRHLLLQRWSAQAEGVIAGIGYAPPLLRMLDRRPEKTSPNIALMPIDQGAIYWPVHTDNRSILADELMPPFAPNSLQRVLMVHALEFSERPLELLQVYWQMLSPGGQVILIAPNRRGLWAHLGRTPFARGARYSISQMKDLLEEAQFTLGESTTALHAPPSTHPLMLRLWPVLEWLGAFLLPGLGGVAIIEAEKQIYAGLGAPVITRARTRWAGAALPVGESRAAPRNRI